MSLQERLGTCLWLSPRRRSAICGFLVGALLSLVLIAAPLWLVGSGPTPTTLRPGTDATALAALSTEPLASPQFDISPLLIGEWAGEICPDDGQPIPVTFDFAHESSGDVTYALTIDGDFQSAGLVANGACDVDGENIVFHSFLAILNECDEACGVDRLYRGHFEEGALVGDYRDVVGDEACLSCVGGGTWWLAPEQRDL
jgi:hypothetical protein